jgi:hypothetical protein
MLQLLNHLTATYLNDYRNHKWASFLRTFNPHNAPIWRVVRYFTKRRDIMPPLFHQGTQYYTSDQKAALLAQQFEMNHCLTAPQQLTSQARAVERMVDKFSAAQEHEDDDVPLIHSSEVRHLLRQLKPHTAPGHDGISNILLRNLPSSGITHLTSLFNASLRLGYFPASWKHAKVLAILKPRK